VAVRRLPSLLARVAALVLAREASEPVVAAFRWNFEGFEAGLPVREG
jgi:hypothetical protein